MRTTNPEGTGRQHLQIPEHVRANAEELCDAVRSVSGFSAVVVTLQSEDGAVLSPVGWLLGGGVPGESELTESATGDTPGAKALSLAVTLSYSDVDIPGSELPLWASARGFTTGIVIPLIKHGIPFGVVYALRRDPAPPSENEVHLSELAVAHGGRTLPILVREEMEEGDFEGLSTAAFESVRDLSPLHFAGIEIDPLREQARISGADISLSRTEFLMLYTLGRKANKIVPHHALLEACWPDDFPALSAVDATVYRLRKKLSLASKGAGKEFVKTVRGKGYMLTAELAVEQLNSA